MIHSISTPNPTCVSKNKIPFSLFTLFTFTVFLALFLAGHLGLSGCSGGGGPDENLIKGCTLDNDCDGLLTICDSDDSDATNLTPTEACDADGDGYVDYACGTDSDGDGVLYQDEISQRFLCDNCVGQANSDQADADKDGMGDICDGATCPAGDSDGDTVCDDVDNCPNAYNPDQTADINGDGVGDACDDDNDGDNDEIDNTNDPCPDIGKSEEYEAAGTDTNTWDGCGYDTDEDGIYDHEECPSCVNVANSSMSTSCGIDDSDADGYPDTCDNCPNDSNPLQADMDEDGIGSACDDDKDGDGLGNDGDLCPRNDEDSWSFSNFKVHVAKTAYCFMDDSGLGYETKVTMNGLSYDYCNNKVTFTKQELIDTVDALLMIYGFLTLGAIDPTQRFIDGTWDDIADFEKASNYLSSITTCQEGVGIDTTEEYERIICGTLQNDSDNDGIGDECEGSRPMRPARPTSH